ncbi:TPA: hypothetical protein ACG3ZG_004558 [Yersinia enterocolitica]|nr:hypothetical protein [Yersinia enterocolitica]HDL6653681.1 hypothetical protein [Yersinia enterocolitica]HDL8439149.1 hypothetical protein [Yersinia enterocolitica]HEF9708171.1 hypothetical protein [Yersinia enterocolitica]
MDCDEFFVSGAIGEQIWAPTWRFGSSTAIFNIMGISRIFFLKFKKTCITAAFGWFLLEPQNNQEALLN